MATTYEPANGETYGLLKTLYDKYRTDLANTDAKVLLLFAYRIDHKPALKHRGKPVLGLCRVHKYRDKVEGKPDATITLDGVWWARASHQQRLALLHHELMHIDHYDGAVDELGRCDLRSRRGDWDFDGFFEVMTLYGEDSCEYRTLQAITDYYRRHQDSKTSLE